MAKKVVLDSMIRRADFAQQAEAASIELGNSLMINQLVAPSPMLRLLRKPDFQRETNHWTPEQVASFVRSFATGELIPSLILWKSDSFVFVIDGAHRLSALRAWVENDYGDGTMSHAFFGGNLTEEQKKQAARSRKLVEQSVGRYTDFSAMSEAELSDETPKAKLASKIFTRSIHVQWIQGSQEVAEASFFKINSQGTPLDSVEELLLRNRRKSYAIAARSIVRAGTGHKYWSAFEKSAQDEIEHAASFLNSLLFQPDIKEPIKTLDLPLGGTTSPVDALKILMDMFALMDGESEPAKALQKMTDDPDGQLTVQVLKAARKLSSRITGNDAGSLGLHPAVYFYNENGKHSRFLFLGIVKAISIRLQNNDSGWFKKFIAQRSKIEQVLIDRKSLINQGLANINSRQRVDRVANLLTGLVIHFEKSSVIDDQAILNMLGLKGNAGNLKIIDAPTGFSDSAKSAVYLRDSLASSLKCSVCGGFIDSTKSVSYDHKKRVREGGKGEVENGQLLHPYCDSSVKS